MSTNYQNETIANILTRTCCRKFRDKPVPYELIQTLIMAAQSAPSAKNRQPWYFIVITNRKCKEEIAKAASIGRQKQFANWDKNKAKAMIKGNSYLNSNDGIIAQAPLAILVIRNSNPDYKEALKNELDIKEEEGVACACYSIMLAAWSLGLGTAWLCSALYIKTKLKRILKDYGVNWQKTWEPRVILALGYPRTLLSKPSRKPTKDISQTIG
jgi:nitroreductase